MATVRIYLAPHETESEAKELLLKALTSQDSGATHTEEFQQPAARDVFERMLNAHDAMWQNLLREISTVLDDEMG